MLTPNLSRSVYNVTAPFEKNVDVLALGHCYDENPQFSLIATNTPKGISITLNDESGQTTITPKENGGDIYNFTTYLPLEKNYQFHLLGVKR